LFLIESIAMNRDFWPKSAKKSAKIAKLDDFIAIERTIMGLINRDLIVDFQAILSTWGLCRNSLVVLICVPAVLVTILEQYWMDTMSNIQS
jgi:hypothetical protein